MQLDSGSMIQKYDRVIDSKAGSGMVYHYSLLLLLFGLNNVRTSIQCLKNFSAAESDFNLHESLPPWLLQTEGKHFWAQEAVVMR